MKSIYCFFVLLVIVNCVKNDVHPSLLRGTTFYEKNDDCDCSNQKNRIIFSAKKTDHGKLIKVVNTSSLEYFFLSFYFSRIFGTYENGDIGLILKKELQGIELKDNQVILVELSKITYKSNIVIDLLNDFLPGAFIRFNKYNLSFNIKIMESWN